MAISDEATCQIVQSLQDLLLPGEVQGEVIEGLVQIDVGYQNLGGGGRHGNPGEGPTGGRRGRKS